MGGERSQAPLRSAAAVSLLNVWELRMVETSALLSNLLEISGLQELLEGGQIGNHAQAG